MCKRHESGSCQPGCTCKRHKPATGRSKCAEGCTCKRHDRPTKIRWESDEARRAYNREYARQRRALDPVPSRESARRYAAKKPYYVKYRMSKQDWQDLLDRQGGCCYLCGDPLDTTEKRKIHVDHDHSCCKTERTCGQCVRGLACKPCTQALGWFKDDPERMRRAADALEIAQARVLARQAISA